MNWLKRSLNNNVITGFALWGCLFLAVVALTEVDASAPQGYDQPVRIVDFSDEVTTTTFLLNLVYRHPRIHALNSTFDRSIPNLYKYVKGLAKSANLSSDIYKIEPQPVYGITYFDGNDTIKYDESGLNEIRSELIRRAASVFESLEKSGKSLSLNTLDTDLKDFSHSDVDDVFYLLPFLYDEAGHSKYDDLASDAEQDKLLQALENISGAELHTTYEKRLKASADIAGPRIQGKIQSIINNFVNKFLGQNLIQRNSSGDIAHANKLSLEEVPNLVALIRGAVGIDCSMNSVAFHALISGAKIYWIRASHKLNEMPIGYAIALPVKNQNKIVPFLLTVNGPGVRPQFIGPILDMVSQLWNSERVAFPYPKDLEGTINYPELGAEMLKQASATTKVLPINSEWAAVDEYLTNFGAMKYINYYTVLGLSSIPVQMRQQTVRREIIKLGVSRAYQMTDFSDLPLYQRARLGARFTRYFQPTSKTFITAANILKVSVEQIQYARKFENSNRKNTIDPGDLKKGVLALAMQPIDLLRFIGTRSLGLSLKNMIYDYPSLITDPTWKPLIDSLLEKISAEIKQLGDRQQTTKASALKRIRTALMNEHRDAKLWNDIEDSFASGNYPEIVKANLNFLQNNAWTDTFWALLETYNKYPDTVSAFTVLELVISVEDVFRMKSRVVRAITKNIAVNELILQILKKSSPLRKNHFFLNAALASIRSSSAILPLKQIFEIEQACRSARISANECEVIDQSLIGEKYKTESETQRIEALKALLLIPAGSTHQLILNIALISENRAERLLAYKVLGKNKNFKTEESEALLVVTLKNLERRNQEEQDLIFANLPSGKTSVSSDIKKKLVNIYIDEQDSLRKAQIKSVLIDKNLWNAFDIRVWKAYISNFFSRTESASALKASTDNVGADPARRSLLEFCKRLLIGKNY